MKKERKKQESSRKSGGSFFNYREVLAGVLLAGLILRLIYVVTAAKIPFNFLSDSSQYYSWARSLMEGKTFIDVFHQGPLYPYFLAFILSLFGDSIFSVLAVQAVMGTASCYLVYLLSAKIFNDRWIGVAASTAMALYTTAIFYDGMLLMATLVTFLDLVFLLVLFRALETGKKWLWGVSGFVLGLSALARSTILLFIPFLVIYLVFRGRAGRTSAEKSAGEASSGSSLKQIIFPVFIFVTCVCLTILPATLRNYFKGNDQVLIAANGGITFFEGNNPWSTGLYEDPPGLDLATDFNGGRIAEYIEGKPLRPSEISRFWFRRAGTFIRNNPGDFAGLLLKKFAYFWNRYEIPNAENIYFAKQYSKVLQLPLLNFLIIGSLGLLGMVMAVKKKMPHVMIPILFLVSQMAAVVLFFVTARYRLPVVPVLAVFAGFAFLSLIRDWRDKKYRDVRRWSVVGLVFVVFVSIPWPGLDRKRDYASSYDNIGILFHLKGDRQGGIRYYRMAMDHDPSFSKPYNNLGAVYYQMGEKEKAIEYMNKGLKRNPDSGLLHMNLGNMHMNERNIEKALYHYRTASPNMPYSIKMQQIAEELGLKTPARVDLPGELHP